MNYTIQTPNQKLCEQLKEYRQINTVATQRDPSEQIEQVIDKLDNSNTYDTCTRCNKTKKSYNSGEFYVTRKGVYRSICNKCKKEVDYEARCHKKKWCSYTQIQSMLHSS
jgi:hypothetical protein